MTPVTNDLPGRPWNKCLSNLFNNARRCYLSCLWGYFSIYLALSYISIFSSANLQYKKSQLQQQIKDQPAIVAANDVALIDWRKRHLSRVISPCMTVCVCVCDEGRTEPPPADKTPLGQNPPLLHWWDWTPPGQKPPSSDKWRHFTDVSSKSLVVYAYVVCARVHSWIWLCHCIP